MGRLAACCLALALLGGTAAAESKADALFKEGKKLMSEKRYANACTSFEQSMKLDPAIGTELNVAKCFEEWGKLGRALRAYQKAESMADEAKDARLAKIHELIAQLDPSVPRLTLKVAADADITALAITLDGNALDKAELGKPQIVDPGPHLVEWKVGSAKKNKLVPVERGSSSEVALEVPAGKPEPATEPVVGKTEPKPEAKPGVKPEAKARPYVVDAGRNQRYLAYGIGGAGVVLVGVSSILTLSARSNYNSALASHCMNMTNACDPSGLTQTHDARHEANIATGLFIVGAAAVGVGAWLYVTAPHGKRRVDAAGLHVVPSVSSDGAGVVVGGTL